MGWLEATLSEVAEVKLGRQRSPKNHTGTHMRPYLRAANVTWGGLDLTDVKEMNFSPQEFETFELRKGDVLLAEGSGSASEVGKPAIWREAIDRCCFQNTLLRVRSYGMLPEFLLYVFFGDARAGRLGDASRGVGIHHIGAQRMSQWRVPLPPLAEQHRIVAAIDEQFSRLDAAEESLHRARRNLERFRLTVFSLASDGDWAWTTLGEIADVAGGVTKDSKRQSDPSYVEVPYLRVANVQRGYLDLSEIATIRVAPAKAKALALEQGDVLFNEGGDRDKLGRGWVWNGEIPDCIHQDHVFRARLTHEFDSRFVSWHGNTFGRRWFEDNGRQTTNLASLNMTTLKAFPVPAPPIDEQERIVAEVERQLSLIDAQSVAIDVALKRSASLRRAILERAFTGKLVPQDPNDEPASVLLDRIRAERLPANKRTRATARS
jgi:type I restriction enzyme, S subunit